jgi:uncharacterized membrane protein YdjX (TVP38/TMEM64 family)
MTVVDPDAFDRRSIARARARLAGLTVALACAGVGLLVVLALDAERLSDRADALGVVAAPALVVLGALLIAAMVPAGLLAGAAGYALGTPYGTAVALLAATAGAVLCAGIGRYVGTPVARHAFGGRVTRLAAWFEARPFRSVAISRLVPGLPFNATSYVLGFTGIPLRHIALGTAVGFAPRCFAYVALGGSLRDLSSPQARIALALSVVLAVLVTIVPRLVLGAPIPGREPGEGQTNG